MTSATKKNQLFVSWILSSVICLGAYIMALLEFVGAVKVIHPLFWLPIATASLGVAGSTYMQLRSGRSRKEEAMLTFYRSRGLRAFALWLFGGLPIDVLVGSVLVWIFFIGLPFSEFSPDEDVDLVDQIVFIGFCTLSFGLYFMCLRDKIIRALRRVFGRR